MTFFMKISHSKILMYMVRNKKRSNPLLDLDVIRLKIVVDKILKIGYTLYRKKRKEIKK